MAEETNNTRFFWKSCEYLISEQQLRPEVDRSNCPPSSGLAGSESPSHQLALGHVDGIYTVDTHIHAVDSAYPMRVPAGVF